jgi:hypothetical protein
VFSVLIISTFHFPNFESRNLSPLSLQGLVINPEFVSRLPLAAVADYDYVAEAPEEELSLKEGEVNDT